MEKRFKLVLIITAAIVLIVAVMSSCNPEKKIQKAIKTLKNTDRLDDVCAENYPAKDIYIKGDTVFNYDTLWGEGRLDTFMVNDTIFIQKTSKPIIITKTRTVIDTVKQRDLAFENVLKDKMDSLARSNYILIKQNSQLIADVDNWKSKAQKRWWFMWAIVVVCVGVTFRKPFLKLLKLSK